MLAVVKSVNRFMIETIVNTSEYIITLQMPSQGMKSSGRQVMLYMLLFPYAWELRSHGVGMRALHWVPDN